VFDEEGSDVGKKEEAAKGAIEKSKTYLDKKIINFSDL